MNTWHTAPHYTAAQWARLHDEARERALALRAEAMDAFWRDVGDAVLASGRAANRLAHSLRRHAGAAALRRMPAVRGPSTVEA